MFTDHVPLVKVLMPPRETLMPELEAVLYGGQLAEGEYVYEFERNFAESFGLQGGLAMSSGTAAIHVALTVFGIGAGDHVISTSMTAEPTNTAILQAGARPVFADVNPLSGNLDPSSVERKIDSRTKAICVVHYAGYPAQMTELRAIADKHGLVLIEDCAHALGAISGGRPVGTIGDAAIFSFQAIKHMTTIDGGFLTLRNQELLSEARKLRWFGMTKGVPRTEVNIKVPGFKYNMTNVSACIGLHQLRDIRRYLERHIENGLYFDNAFRNSCNIDVPAYVVGDVPSYWIYTLLSDASKKIADALNEQGIMASKLHRPNHFHDAFKCDAGDLDNLDKFYGRLLHIPCGWWLTNDQRERIVEIVKQAS